MHNFNYFYPFAVGRSLVLPAFELGLVFDYIMKMICVPDLVFVCVYGPELCWPHSSGRLHNKWQVGMK